MRVLVAGGAGFIGSRLVRGLLAGEYGGIDDRFAAGRDLDVVVLDNFTYAGNEANLAAVAGDARLRVVRGDITSRTDLDRVVPGADLVVNLAAETHVDRSIAAADRFVHTNVLGAQQLFDACVRHGAGLVVHASTDEVYGSAGSTPCDEDAPLRPSTPYAGSKAAADVVAHAYAVTYGLDVRITRSTNNYGPYQFPEKLVPRFVTGLLRGERVPVYGSGEHRRDWLHVDDNCRALLTVAVHGLPAEVYNVGGGTELSNLELTGLLLAETGRDASHVEHVADPRGPGHDLRYSVDTSKLAALGFAPRVDLRRGLADTVGWYRDNPDRWSGQGVDR